MSSQNLILGRGKVYFDLYAPGTQIVTGRRYIGNTPEFALDVTATQLEHYSMDQGLKFVDDSTILMLDRKGTFKTDEVSAANMALFLIGEYSVQTQTATAALATQTSVIPNVLLDRYYQIGLTAGNVTGVRNLLTATVNNGATPPVAYTLNTDYTVDLALGLLYITPTSSIVPGTSVSCVFTLAAATRDQIQTTVTAAQDGALSFIAYNPKGVQRDYFMPYVRLTPNGAFALKGDVWQEVGFNLSILLLDPSMAHIYLDGRPYVAGVSQ